MKRKHSNYRMRSNLKFTNPPFWRDDDILSNLPNDCLTRVHRHLDKYSLESLASTSQRMRHTANWRLSVIPDEIRRLNKLEIVRTSTGHSLVASGADTDHFIYYVDQSDPSVYHHFSQRVNTDIKGLTILTPCSTSKFSIPLTVRAKMRELMKKNQFDELSFNRVAFDWHLLRSCKTNLIGKLKKMSFNVDFDLVKNHETFLKWIIESGAEDVSFSTTHWVVPKFDEQFLHNFVGDRTELRLTIHKQINHFFVYDAGFMPRFSTLIHHSIVISVSQLRYCINKRLATENASGLWEISFYFEKHNPLFLFQLKNIQKANLNEGVFTCGRADNSNSVKISFRSTSIRKSTSIPSQCHENTCHQATIEFFNNNEWLEFENIPTPSDVSLSDLDLMDFSD